MTGEESTETASSEPDGAATVTGLLDDRYQRYALYCLRLYSTPLQLVDIAHQLVIWTLAEPADEHLDTKLRIRDDLSRDVLPALLDADVVTYDRSEGLVRWGPAKERLEPHLEDALREELAYLLWAEARAFDGSGDTEPTGADATVQPFEGG